jgi:hypothetical protein
MSMREDTRDFVKQVPSGDTHDMSAWRKVWIISKRVESIYRSDFVKATKRHRIPFP